jgi:hypothetical protein
MNVPRAAYVRFPYGNPLGLPDEPEMQKEILRTVLQLAVQAAEPGLIARLSFRWRAASNC